MNVIEVRNNEHFSESGTGTSVQTDLSLLNVEEKVAAYLEKLNDGKPISEEVCKTRKPTISDKNYSRVFYMPCDRSLKI